MSSNFVREFVNLKIPLESIRNATNNFDERNRLGRGGFGTVYKGVFSTKEGGTIFGAVKRWNVDAEAEFRREIKLLCDNRHENLILLHGYCDEANERVLVYEYAANKSLDFHLTSPTLTWVERLNICLGAARGLEYLHNPKGAQRVLHCDVKSANILLDENYNAKIADFGFSEYGPATQNCSYLVTRPKGTPGYIDPAFVETMIYRKESDVYSFGMVLLEVLCSRLCVDYSYHQDDYRRYLLAWAKKMTKKEIQDKIIYSNLRKEMKQDSFKTFIKLAFQCVEREPKHRPSMDLIVKTLESALKYQEKKRVSKMKTASGVLLGIAVAVVLL